ncbi:SRPBCC family protein [Sinomonas sp. ASV322]|uniref:SRPBCC family protein n=1 Tax=Sinomonas sp. ASV322 TaxID=3041920 RepID=UPI0027DB2FAC|nr:SRPBCC family protein [Sinomonas sp. ASV322]MDQ4501468.1 SRPBCC family protein [Sinomonas sp. ASV322]
MSALTNTIEINRPPEEVFGYASDPLHFSEWQADVVEIHFERGGGPEVGARFTTTRRIGRMERTMTQEITEDEPPRRFAAHGVSGPIRANASIDVEPIDDGARSRVTFELDFEGHGFGRALVPIVRQLAAKGAPMSHRRLKERLESGT